jgi:nitroreductase
MERQQNLSSARDLIRQRKSCRAYTSQPVALETVQTLLETAKWAPSGVNHQPSKVAILGPKTRAKLASSLLEKFDAEAVPNPDYDFCHDLWPESYKIRRKACGQALYQSLGIALDDRASKKVHKRRNYNFFEAPVGLIIFIDQGMPKGSWLDVGLFIQNFLIAAEDLGLSTCAQASFAEYPDVVRDVLSFKSVDIICGIALGYGDAAHPLNSYRTERCSLEEFAHWYE